MVKSNVVPIAQGVAKKLSKAERPELLDTLGKYRDYRDEWIRRQVIDHNRIDILATEVLGYIIKPFHLKMLQFQFLHPDNLQLAPRGFGKSTVCTVTKIVHLLLCDRNLRILLASKTKGNSENFLKEAKGHLESNEDLIRIFGEFYNPKLVRKWTDAEIDVVGRTNMLKESNVTCLGVDSAIVSRHYDVIISDDLVDEENSRTKGQRDKTKTWYYQTMDPTLEPPEEGVRFRGEHHRLGTRYHYDDLWGHLIENELRDHHQVISALDAEGNTPWPEKFSAKFLKDKKRKAGTIIFNAQYQNDCEAMKGEVFKYDDCIQVAADRWPNENSLRIYMGVDLAISEKDTADQFAIVVVGVDGRKGDAQYYILDFFAGQLRFSQQTDKIIEMYDRWDPITGFVESNAYQLAQLQTLKEKRPMIRLKPHQTDKDKMSRAWKLSAVFEDGRVNFRKDEAGPLIDQLVLFPNHRFKDLFDALDFAIKASRRRRKKRRTEPGVL